MKLQHCTLIMIIFQSTFQKFIISEGDDLQDEYCARVDQNQCRFCYMSVLFNGKCIPLSDQNTINHCIQYQDKSQCLVCQLNYIPNEEGKCQRVDTKNCVKSDLQGNCQVCKAGYLVKDGRCDSDSRCNIKNCQFCYLNQGLEDCMVCQDGFVNKITQDEQGARIECVESNATPNCLNLKINQNKCNICRLNYYMNEVGQCIKSSKYQIDLIGSKSYILMATFIITFLF